MISMESQGELATGKRRSTCFIAMPISMRQQDLETYRDTMHWAHVMETLFLPAIKSLDMTPITPIAKGSDLIHGEIVRNLTEADIVLCDLSAHNPNVFFELGVRTALNKPVCLVRDEHTALPFDTQVINTATYSSTLQAWDVENQLKQLSNHLRASILSCKGVNPLWRNFGLHMRAEEPITPATSPVEAQMRLLSERVNSLLDAYESPSIRTAETSAATAHRGQPSQIAYVSSAGNEPQNAVPADKVIQREITRPNMEGFLRRAREVLSDGAAPARLEADDDDHAFLITRSPEKMPPQLLTTLKQLARSYGVEVDVRR